MHHILAPLFTVMQATLEGWGLLLLIPLFWAPVTRWRGETRLMERCVWSLGLPLPWVLLAYWTSFNWHEGGGSSPDPVSKLAECLALATLVGALTLALTAAILNRNTRWFFAGWGLVNSWFAAVGALLCIMATSGNWL